MLADRLKDYPRATDGLCVKPPVPREPDPYRPQDGPSVELYWQADGGSVRPLDTVTARLGGENSGAYLMPGLGANRDRLASFAATWAVLLALSSAARYHPDRWVAALDRDKSVLAIPIEEALGRTRELLPWLMLHALNGTLRRL
jgi:hypothetical protein